MWVEDYEYVDTDKLVIRRPRNVIVVFMESFEKMYSKIKDGEKELSVDVDGALMYDGFVEGHGQRKTIDALFAAFRGQYHYLSRRFEKYFSTKQKLESSFGQVAHKNVVDFDVLGIGNVFSLNGYQLLFAQGGDIIFMGTEGLLEEQKFKKDNVYGRHSFEGTPAFRGWWGVEDRYVFELFENKISNLDFSKPFFAVMFTIDLHGACGAEENPAFVSFDDVQKSTIKNLNNFIAWFKKQPFYANTTLVVAGDHRRMGEQQNAGRELFNAFYNLPGDLKSEYDNTRRFNHIDMCPTLMEIAGVNLPKRKYGFGVSIFSDEKTLEERFGDF